MKKGWINMTIYNKERKNKIYLFNRFIFDSVSIKLCLLRLFLGQYRYIKG